MCKLPNSLESCDEKRRNFPMSSKEAYFRIYFNEEEKGYICPSCKTVFRGSQGFSMLFNASCRSYLSVFKRWIDYLE